MACNVCETGFQGYQTIITSIQKSGNNALLYVGNQGRNIVLLRRILLCFIYPTGGATTMYLRPPPDSISWLHPSAYLETGVTSLFYRVTNLPTGTIAQAQSEYVEIEGRSRSCAQTI
jgi:hypothetical protein